MLFFEMNNVSENTLQKVPNFVNFIHFLPNYQKTCRMLKLLNNGTVLVSEGFSEEIKQFVKKERHQKVSKNTKRSNFCQFKCIFCTSSERFHELEAPKRSKLTKHYAIPF